MEWGKAKLIIKIFGFQPCVYVFVNDVDGAYVLGNVFIDKVSGWKRREEINIDPPLADGEKEEGDGINGEGLHFIR